MGTPVLKFRETDQSLPAGLWRWALDGDVFKLQKNTAAGGDFSTLTQPIQINSSDQVGIGGVPNVKLSLGTDVTSKKLALYDAVGSFYGFGIDSGRINFYTADHLSMVISDQSKLWINETSNSKQTMGLTINQGANDDEILALKSDGDVSHGMTAITEDDTYGFLGKVNGGAGGLNIEGFNDSWNSWGLGIGATVGGALTTTKSTAGAAGMVFSVYEPNGTNRKDPVTADGNLFAFRNGGTTRAILDVEGDLHLDATLTQDAWDDHDDLVLLHGLRASMVPSLQERFGHFIEQAKPILERDGIVTYNDDGHHFIAMKKWNALLTDTIRQEGMKWRAAYEDVAKKMAGYERALIELGADPKLLTVQGK